MSGMGKPTSDQQTWVYRSAVDAWLAGATSGGSFSTGSFTTTAGIAPKITKVIDNVAGNGAFNSTAVTNWTGSYSTIGNPCVIVATAAGFPNNAGLTTFNLFVDGTKVASTSLYQNTAGTHQSFESIYYLSTLSSGSHNLSLTLTGNGSNTLPTADVNDYANIWILEFSGSVTTAGNVTIVTGAVGNSFQQANYFTASITNQVSIPNGTVFNAVPGVNGTLTTSGGPVFISVNANAVANTTNSQMTLSLARNGVNVGHPLYGLQVGGPTVATFNQNMSYTFVDFPAAGTYTYSLIACSPTGSGLLNAWDVGPTVMMAFEMKGANVVTASSMVETAVPGGNVAGLSASILPTRGPVLAIASINYSGDLASSWAYATIARDGTNLGGTTAQALNVGTTAGECMNMSMMFLDQGASLGTSHTYTVQATNGANTGKINKNGQLGTLILWELSDINYKYATSTTQTALGSGFTDVVPSTPSPMITTRGRPVLLGWGGQINTSQAGSRSGWTFLRNGTSVTTASKGLQLVDDENNNDWNRVPSMFWLDVVPQGSYVYQVAGKNVSGSQFVNQTPAGTDSFFLYEVDSGANSPIVVGGWIDQTNVLSTTASVTVGSFARPGTDAQFYVSGTIGLTGSRGKVAVFGGDVVVSGSITVAGSSVSTGSSGTSTSSPWTTIFDQDFRQASNQNLKTVNTEATFTIGGYQWGVYGGPYVTSIDVVNGSGVVIVTQANTTVPTTCLSSSLALLAPNYAYYNPGEEWEVCYWVTMSPTPTTQGEFLICRLNDGPSAGANERIRVAKSYVSLAQTEYGYYTPPGYSTFNTVRNSDATFLSDDVYVIRVKSPTAVEINTGLYDSANNVFPKGASSYRGTISNPTTSPTYAWMGRGNIPGLDVTYATGAGGSSTVKTITIKRIRIRTRSVT